MKADLNDFHWHFCWTNRAFTVLMDSAVHRSKELLIMKKNTSNIFFFLVNPDVIMLPELYFRFYQTGPLARCCPQGAAVFLLPCTQWGIALHEPGWGPQRTEQTGLKNGKPQLLPGPQWHLEQNHSSNIFFSSPTFISFSMKSINNATFFIKCFPLG